MKLASLLITLLFLSSNTYAADWSRLLCSLTETAGDARVAVHGAEDAGARLIGRKKLLRESAEKEARQLDSTHVITRSQDLVEILARALAKQGANVDTINFLKTLPEDQIQAAAVYARGGRRLHEAVPDLAIRGRINRQGGAPMLAALGLLDEVPADDFMKMDALIAAGRLPVEVAGRPTLAKLGEMLGESATASREFYARYVRGNEKLWVGGGALAAWIAAPEAFQDAAGKLTEAGLTRLGSLVGELNAAAIRGFAAGSKEAASKSITAIKESFFQGWDAWTAWFGLAVLFCILYALSPRLRSFITVIFRLLRLRS